MSEKRPVKDSTKVWITSTGKCLVANNNSKIPEATLRSLVRIIETRSFEIISKWNQLFGEIKFFY